MKFTIEWNCHTCYGRYVNQINYSIDLPVRGMGKLLTILNVLLTETIILFPTNEFVCFI